MMISNSYFEKLTWQHTFTNHFLDSSFFNGEFLFQGKRPTIVKLLSYFTAKPHLQVVFCHRFYQENKNRYWENY